MASITSRPNSKEDLLLSRKVAGVVLTVGKRVQFEEEAGELHSVKPWRVDDVLGKPLGRRG
jgi:hypothetical protein